MRVVRARTFSLFGNGKNRRGDGRRAGHRIDRHAPDKGVDRSISVNPFVHHGPLSVFAAADDRADKGCARPVSDDVIGDFLRGVLEPQRALQEIAVRPVAAVIPHLVSVDFEDTHGQRVEVLPQIVVIVGQDGQIVQADPAGSGVVLRLCGVFELQGRAIFEERKNPLKWQRLPVVVSLDSCTADFLEEVGLFLFFHALADGLHAETDRHLHQLRQDDLALVPLVETLHETHVELDEVKVDLLQHVEGGVAAAEVIHPHREAELPEAVHLRLHELEVTADDALRDLNGDHGAIDAGVVHPLSDLLHDVAGVKVGAGEVDGLGHHVEACLRLLLHLFQHLLEHVEIQLIDQPGLFERGYKLGGGKKTEGRIDPAGQRLFVADLAVGGPDDRLVVHLDPALGKRAVQVVVDIAVAVSRFQHAFIKPGVAR